MQEMVIVTQHYENGMGHQLVGPRHPSPILGMEYASQVVA